MWLLDKGVTLSLLLEKVHENLSKMSTRKHPKHVHKNSPKKINSHAQNVHENLPKVSRRIHLFCPRKFIYVLLCCFSCLPCHDFTFWQDFAVLFHGFFLNVETNRKYFNAEHVDPSSNVNFFRKKNTIISNAKWKLEMSHDIKIQILSQHNRHNYSLMKKKWLFWTVANSFIYCLSYIHFFFLTITDFLGRVKTRQIHIF